MKIVHFIKSLKIYPKLVLTFFISLLPIYVIGLMMNQSGTHHVKSEIAHSLNSRVNLYMEMLEGDFGHTIQFLQEYVNDEDLMKLSSSADIMSQLEINQAVLRLKEKLDILKESSKFVDDAFVMIPSIDRTVSSNVNAISEMDHQKFDELRKVKNLFESPFIQIGSRVYIAIPYPDPSTTQNQNFIIGVEVSRSGLSSALHSFTSVGGEAVLAGRNIPWVVAGSMDKSEETSFINQMKKISSTTAGQNFKIGSKTYMVTQKESKLLDVTMTMFVPTTDMNKSLKDYEKWLLLLSLASILLIMIFSYLIYRMIHQPLKNLIAAFRRMETGDFDIALTYPFHDEFGYLYEQFNSTVKQLDVLVHEVYEQQYRASLSELRHLQSQINPHFLYNTYFILYRMAMLKDTENIILLAKYLGEYFQYITRDGIEDVPFEREAKHAKNYIDIQSIRFANRIQADFEEIPEQARLIPVPRLILQPIIENAYQYALEKKPKGAWLKVQMRVSEIELNIRVEDNGGELTMEKLNKMIESLNNPKEVIESTGLVNVHRRIKIKYGERGGVYLSMNDQNGLRVDMIIPLEMKFNEKIINSG
ncbi:sensor histidine kinase [Neobacillus sp. Marseille-QA0830]